MKAIILAAGSGSRLGLSIPKGLLRLPTGETILSRQVRIMNSAGLMDITIVVGYKKELIMSSISNVQYKFNPEYHNTNTAKSLLYAIDQVDDDILWTNGDTIYDEEVISLIKSQRCNTMIVNTAKCGDEEVKYRTDDDGNIISVSKNVQNSLGEALGINMVMKESLKEFTDALQECRNDDYFERAIQILINNNIVFKPLNISKYRCIEVDNKEDWENALRLFR